MDIEAAFRSERSKMQRYITAFCGDEDTSKDAVSQAFMSAWINRDMLEAMPDPAMMAWLYACARNAAVDIKRRESRYVPMPDYDTPDTEGSDLINKITAEELTRVLPPELSIPIHMKYYQGMNSTVIGHIMGIPPATVRTRLRKALNVMRRNTKGAI